MQNHKYFTLTGEVIFRGSPVQIPMQYYKSVYFTLKCSLNDLQRNGTYSVVEDYFNIHTYKAKSIESIREGYVVTCLVRRDGKIWTKDGEIVTRFDSRTKGSTKVNFGTHPVVFESYHLIGEIEILDNSLDKEYLKRTNRDFEYFMDNESKSE